MVFLAFLKPVEELNFPIVNICFAAFSFSSREMRIKIFIWRKESVRKNAKIEKNTF
jgi:hypothetical protein